MADWIDEAQQLDADRREDALADLRRHRAPLPAATGICRDCGDPIDPERLAALPQATRCIDCQLAAERIFRK